jgi:hypothetical protein
MKMKELLKYLGHKINNLFLWSSGADLEILNQVPIEKSKYFGIGGTIIFTALMASFAGGYAFFTAFKNTYLALPFGIFWGSLIFNLDRYIVASFGVGDGKKTISKQELIEAAPRLAMAIILGFVISTPLELKLFEKEINVEIQNIIGEERTKLDDGQKPILRIISSKKTEIQKLKDEQNSYESKAEDLSKKTTIEDQQIKFIESQLSLLNSEIQNNQKKYNYYNGIALNTNNDFVRVNAIRKKSIYNNTKNYKKKAELINKINELQNSKLTRGQEYFDQAKESRKSNQPKIEALEKEITILNDKIGRSRDENEEISKQYSGLMARLEALSRLTDKYTILFIVKWLISILFVFIEIAPILFKMMTERGPYDDIVDRKKHEYKVRQLEIQSNINQEINIAVRIHNEKYEQKLNAELESNKKILEAISKAQQEIAIAAIEKWKKEQKEILIKSKLHDIVK